MMGLLPGREGDMAIREGTRERPVDARRDALIGHLGRSLDRAYALAAVILGDRADAEEATHDAVCTAWRGIDGLREPERVEAWFTRILVNACRDRLRRRKVRPIRVELDGATAAASAVDDAFERIDATDELARALLALSPQHRAVVVLRYWDDLPVDEIAIRTGERAGTVKSRLHYALNSLRAVWDRADAERRTPR